MAWGQLNEELRARRAAEIERRGARCEHVYASGRRCRSLTELEFAHIKPTGLSGRGRGQNHRILDMLKHPDHYLLLCRTHHGARDGF